MKVNHLNIKSLVRRRVEIISKDGGNNYPLGVILEISKIVALDDKICQFTYTIPQSKTPLVQKSGNSIFYKDIKLKSDYDPAILDIDNKLLFEQENALLEKRKLLDAKLKVIEKYKNFPAIDEVGDIDAFVKTIDIINNDSLSVEDKALLIQNEVF